MYNTEDHDHPVLGEPAGAGEGRSPRNLLSPTIADQLVAASEGKSRVFSASLKDRGAIIPAGQSGKAFWYSKTTGTFVTSSYYYPEHPEWVVRWNDAGHADQYRNQSWELLLDRDHYVFRDRDDRWFEKPEGLLGTTAWKPKTTCCAWTEPCRSCFVSWTNGLGWTGRWWSLPPITESRLRLSAWKYSEFRPTGSTP